MPSTNCRICLEPLGNEVTQYHAACCRKLFGAPRPPALPYTWEQLNQLAEKTIRQHVTVPGVQPKLSLHLEKGEQSHNSRFTLVGLEGDYILKPPVDAFPQMPELELMTMRTARCFGISTAECGLIPLDGGQLAFITKRMDRDGKTKLHMEDMCQLTDRLTEQKYRGSLEQVGKAVLRYCSNPGFDALRLFEVTLFCFLTGNADMHLKNFSLLYRPGGDIALSPAYDLLPTALLLPEDTEETALTLNGRKKRLTREDFTRFAMSMRLTLRQVENVYTHFSSSISSALQVLDKDLCSPDMKQHFKTLFEVRASRINLTGPKQTSHAKRV
jgi:serine/threonine-protein kinase HipA